MKTEFKPFPPGTIRGPFVCGKGTDPRGGVQFAVHGLNGWLYYIAKITDEKSARDQAEESAAKIKASLKSE